MPIDVFTLRNFSDNNNDYIDVAFPVFAFECEVSMPIEKEIDAYEEAILKFLSIGLTKDSIQKSLNITRSLCGDIFLSLEGRGYIEKIANGHRITQKTNDILNGNEIRDPEMKSKFGYMLISAIKKEALWYFHEGDIFNSAHSDSVVLEKKLRIKQSDRETFVFSEIPGYQIERAFSGFCKIAEVVEAKEKTNLSEEDADALLAGIESDLTEADYEESSENQTGERKEGGIAEFIRTGKARVRKLKTEPKSLYLQMRIIIDPSVPGGYRIESPLDFDENDNDLFLRQIQWMRNPAHNVFLGDVKLSDFLTGEVRKLLPVGNNTTVDGSVFIINKLPILGMEKDKYRNIYEDTREIIDLMNRDNLSNLEKENIVGGFTRKLIERLMDILIKTVPDSCRKNTSRRVFFDFTFRRDREEEQRRQTIKIGQFAEVIGVDRKILPHDQDIGIYFSAIKRLNHTFGNSIYEKLLNLIVFQYYQPSRQIRQFFQYPGIAEYIETVHKLSNIRNMTSHASDIPFTTDTYDYYCNHVFDVANRLLEALKEAV